MQRRKMATLHFALLPKVLTMRPLLLLLIVISGMATIHARIIPIGPGREITRLSQANGMVGPGDTLLLDDGLYSDGSQFLEDWTGDALHPIVILAKNEHQAIFRGGTEAIHLIRCAFLQLEGLVVEQQTGNGINIDDGGNYTTPTHHITVRNCIFRDMAADGNNDLLKLSGLDDFLVEGCSFTNGGDGGSGIDMVGCHHGIIQDNYFDQAGVSGIQAKGGTQFIRIQRNILKDLVQRALNLGGSTGLEYFRPPLDLPINDAFEAADLEVFSNLFLGSRSPIAYVGSIRVLVINNTIYHPANWVVRILQETTESGFLACAENVFQNNLIILDQDLTEVNVGPNTDPESFTFSHNLWYNEASQSWSPQLPVADAGQIIDDPQLAKPADGNFQPAPTSPVVGQGNPDRAPETDFWGNPFQVPPSIGAIEGLIATTARQPFPDTPALSIEPSVATDYLTIRFPYSGGYVRIINIKGVTLIDGEVVDSPMRFDITNLVPGFYFVRWEGDRPGFAIRKFVKM
ncbi:MAG: right-handed parallel beta-helix repeat-containing protein [Saprospiraceae bacterium]